MNDILKAREERNKLCKDLNEYAELEGSEVGEVCQLLIQLVRYSDYITKECYAAIIKEMKDQLDIFTNQFKIVERTETNVITYRELEEVD